MDIAKQFAKEAMQAGQNLTYLLGILSLDKSNFYKWLRGEASPSKRSEAKLMQGIVMVRSIREVIQNID